MKWQALITKKDDKFFGKTIVVSDYAEDFDDAMDDATEEFGENGIDPTTLKPYKKQTVEYVALGKEIFQSFDDGTDRLIMTVGTDDQATQKAVMLSKKLLKK